MSKTIEKWGYFELSLSASASGNPFRDVSLEAEFVQEHRSITVKGFYDGDDTYRVRFMPDTEGDWNYVTHSSLAALDGQTGEFVCTAPTGTIMAPSAWSIRIISPTPDGTPYHPVGTTCYVWNLQGDELEEQTLATLKTRRSTRCGCAFSPNATPSTRMNRPAIPSRAKETSLRRWDFDRFNPEYFRRLEKRILDLQALGIEADLIIFHPYDSGAWGFDRMPAEVNDRYLRYLAARLAAFRNLWWSFANEYDFMSNRNLNDWDHFFQVIEAADPYDHLRSIHNGYVLYNHRKPWVTHCSIQHHDLLLMRTWLEDYGKPVIVDECGYEGDIGMPWGSLSAEAMVECFWLGFAVGGYVGHGETYWNPEEVLWWSKGGSLHGESPARIAFLRQIIEAVPAPGLSPLPANQLRQTFPEGIYKGMAGGRNGDDYFLVYQGRQQPRFRKINLPEGGSYQIDIIDTWNMTIDRFADAATGMVEVELPRKKYLAIRIVRNR